MIAIPFLPRERRSHDARAVVTGAGRGIGRAFAIELARRGGDVVCADIDAARSAETVSIIEAGSGRALAVTCDVGDCNQVETLAVEAEA